MSSSLAGWETNDLKLVYRVLHAHLMDHAELMDSAIFAALQGHLQAEARKQSKFGFDGSDEAIAGGRIIQSNRKGDLEEVACGCRRDPDRHRDLRRFARATSRRTRALRATASNSCAGPLSRPFRISPRS